MDINRHSIIVTTTLSEEALKGAKNHQQLIKTDRKMKARCFKFSLLIFYIFINFKKT